MVERKSHSGIVRAQEGEVLCRGSGEDELVLDLFHEVNMPVMVIMPSISTEGAASRIGILRAQEGRERSR